MKVLERNQYQLSMHISEGPRPEMSHLDVNIRYMRIILPESKILN